MIKAKLVDDFTIEVIAQDGEKFTWNTYFPIPKQTKITMLKISILFSKIF